MNRIPRLPLLLSALLPVPLAALITLLALWCQPNTMEEVSASFQAKPALYALNFLPVLLLVLLFTFLLRNAWFGAAAAGALTGLFSVANHLKILIRDEPVFPRDLALFKEAGGAVGGYHLSVPPGLVLLPVMLTIVLVLAGVLIRFRPCPVKALRGWKGSLAGAAVSFAALCVLTLTVYADMDLYNSLHTSNDYRLSVVFNENGFPYNFFHHFTTYQVDRPAGYSRAQAEAWDKEATEAGTGAAVNVVMVMNEAFSDVTDDGAFAFTEENDPLANLHRIQREEHTISLRLVVPGFAGGTANTEFDVLTGMQTNDLGAATTSAMRTVNRNVDSLFRVFRGEGYATSFFHPGDDWFYNRENVYHWFGAEKTRFVDEMEEPAYKGRWVTDDYLAGQIEEEFAGVVSENRLLFHYATTIQNHMGYPRSKYGEDYEYPRTPLNVAVSEDVQSLIDVYVEGVRDADAMLGRLRDYFAERAEPVVLVYFGDHLPYLGDNKTVYASLGMDVSKADGERADYFSIYETPCVIWANEAAAGLVDIDGVSRTLPENRKLSAAFLGSFVLELTGRGTCDGWNAFLNELRREAPVVQHQVWMKPDGALTGPEAESGTELGGMVRKWRQWTYYKLEQKEIP